MPIRTVRGHFKTRYSESFKINETTLKVKTNKLFYPKWQLFIVVVFGFQISNSQSSNKSNHFGLSIGINHDLNYSDENINAIHSHEVGWNYGLIYEKFISNKWSLNIEYNRFNSKSKIGNYSEFKIRTIENRNEVINTKVGNIKIDKIYGQLNIIFHKYFTDKRKVFFGFGFDVKSVIESRGTWNYVLTEFYKDTYELNPIILTNPLMRNIETKYNIGSGIIGLNIEIGSKFNLFKKIDAFIKCRLNSQIKKTIPSGNIVFRNMELLVGFQY